VARFGTVNDSNGVRVGFRQGHGGGTKLENDHTISVSFGSDIDGDALAVTVAHEGAHVGQARTWLEAGEGEMGNLNHYERDFVAWNVSSFAAQGLGMNNYKPYGGGRELEVWNREWEAAEQATKRARGVANILYYMRDSRTDAGMRRNYVNEHHGRSQ
jgi:hypothetical protein